MSTGLPTVSVSIRFRAIIPVFIRFRPTVSVSMNSGLYARISVMITDMSIRIWAKELMEIYDLKSDGITMPIRILYVE